MKTNPMFRAGLVLALAAPLALRAQTASIETDHHAYFPGEAIRTLFANGPGNRLDWIGIYPEGATPGGPASTLWRYVDGTTSGSVGLPNGSVLFGAGLNFAGPWTAFLLINDNYEIAAQTTFTVVEPSAPLVRRDKAGYAPGEAITITFTNGPAAAKDWIGVYPEGVVPGAASSTIWRYLDGTTSGTTARSSGSVTFGSGLTTPGRYVAYLLANDGYEILASEPLRVAPPVSAPPQLVSSTPANGATNGTPAPRLSATVLPGSGQVTASGVKLQFDGVEVTPVVEVQSDRTLVRYVGTTLLAAGSSHTFRLVAQNTSGLSVTNEITYSVGAYTNIVLPPAIVLETFDTTPEGTLPAGWTGTTHSVVDNEAVDFGDLNSAAYKGWTVVESGRFEGTFLTYSNPNTSAGEARDYQRVHNVNPFLVLNGAPVTRLATGRFLFGNSGYRNGGSQFMVVETPDFDLTGKTDVHLAFHAVWEQNQDSIGSVEYSVDRGTTWLPVLYLLHEPDIVRNESGAADGLATFTAEKGDVAQHDRDGDGLPDGNYGAFIGAAVSEALGPYIEARGDDNPTDGKRVEVRRLPQADGKATVRLRFAHAGTDSWYFGIDNVGLYSIPAVQPQPPVLSAVLEPGGVRISWPAGPTGYVLEQRADVGSGAWTPVPGVSGNSVLVPAAGDRQWFRLKK